MGEGGLQILCMRVLVSMCVAGQQAPKQAHQKTRAQKNRRTKNRRTQELSG